MRPALSLLLLAACGADLPHLQAGLTAAGLTAGSREERALLGLVNDAGTTFALLDGPVGLDRRAAANLIAHRDGPDRAAGTADDDLFDDVAEVDAVRYVGAAALRRLATYALAHGHGDELAGDHDGVYFSAEQAEAALALANGATRDELDREVGLDSRAADNIVRARPLASMTALAAVRYVSATALRRLRDHVERALALPECGDDGACPPGLTCMGRPAVEQRVGRCVDVAAAGWMTREVVYEGAGSIPDHNRVGAGTGSGVLVYGVGPLVSRVVVHVGVTHPRPSDLVLELDTPDGHTVPLARHLALAGPTLAVDLEATAVPAVAAANGLWVLRYLDDVPGASGEYGPWRMRVETRWPTGAETAERLGALTALRSLYHESESDHRYQVVRVPGRGAAVTSASAVRAALASVYVRRPREPGLAGRAVEQADPAAFFERYTEERPGWDRSRYRFMHPYRRLHTLLREELLDLRLYRFGARPVPGGPLSGAIDVFVVGRSRDGDLVGVWTVSVET